MYKACEMIFERMLSQTRPKFDIIKTKMKKKNTKNRAAKIHDLPQQIVTKLKRRVRNIN